MLTRCTTFLFPGFETRQFDFKLNLQSVDGLPKGVTNENEEGSAWIARSRSVIL